MPYTLAQLSDLEEIKLVKHRYFRGIDTADGALLETLFTDDVEVCYLGGGYRVDVRGRANMLEFIANSFNSDALAMHHPHGPEITFTGPDSADGIWYLEDLFINLERRTHTYGSALYRDRYVREGGVWRIAVTHYERVIEVVEPLRQGAEYTYHLLASRGRPREERKDISHLISWTGEG